MLPPCFERVVRSDQCFFEHGQPQGSGIQLGLTKRIDPTKEGWTGLEWGSQMQSALLEYTVQTNSILMVDMFDRALKISLSILAMDAKVSRNSRYEKFYE